MRNAVNHPKLVKLTPVDLDQTIVVDGWNCLSTDLAAAGWAEVFAQQGLVYEFPGAPSSSDESEDEKPASLQGKGFPKAKNATSDEMRPSHTLEKLKDLAQ